MIVQTYIGMEYKKDRNLIKYYVQKYKYREKNEIRLYIINIYVILKVYTFWIPSINVSITCLCFSYYVSAIIDSESGYFWEAPRHKLRLTCVKH